MAAIPNDLKQLFDLLCKHAIELIIEIKDKLKERRIQEVLEVSLEDARKAFYGRVPAGKTIPLEVLNSFFRSEAFKTQYQALLKGQKPNLTILGAAFYEAGYDPQRIPSFSPRLAISEFLDKFIESAVQKELFRQNFPEANIKRLEIDGQWRIYCDQVAKCYENLGLRGVPGAFDQDVIRLEDIFVTLQASPRVPEADVPVDEVEQTDIMKPSRIGYQTERLPDHVLTRESARALSVMEILKEHDNLMILGVPGSGKTTFMRYLALAFARKLSNEFLGLDEDRLPILITIKDIVEELSSGKTIADLLSKYINAELQLNLPPEYFLRPLESGRCVILLDGLDEVISIRQRGEVAHKVSLFANLYRGNRYIITSRIAGYREIQRLPKSDFPHFTIRDLDDNQIKDFIKKWHLARNPLKVEADKLADSLIQAVEQNPKVKQLASTPLMLTIIAVAHRSRASLPNKRIKLYDLCTDALLFTWKKDRPPLTDLHGRLISDQNVRERLEHLAYWMHSEPVSHRGQISYARLKSELKDYIACEPGATPGEEEDEARNFLEYIRKTTGVLLEHGTELYAFVHMTFQEYFAAYYIYRRCYGNVEKVWEEIYPCLHDSHWREVIRLLVAKLNDEFSTGEDLIEKISKSVSEKSVHG